MASFANCEKSHFSDFVVIVMEVYNLYLLFCSPLPCLYLFYTS
jgi:hypothetical protein